MAIGVGALLEKKDNLPESDPVSEVDSKINPSISRTLEEELDFSSRQIISTRKP